MADLSSLFEPRGVVIVGATDREESVGRALWKNLDSYPGQVVPVNPDRDSVFGEACYPTVEQIPDNTPVDLAIVVVPRGVVPDVLQEIGDSGIKNVVVITAGFAEGGETGEKRQVALQEIAEQYDLNLVGPNCVGIASTPSGLNATFLDETPGEGSISLLSQSGAFIAAVLGWASQHGLGFKDIVSLGNEAVLDETNFIATWENDPDTDVILAYMEDIEDGQAFVEAARATTSETPIVALKAGRTEAGAAAAASHTGSIAGSDEAYQAGFDKGGLLRASNVGELLRYGQALAGQPLPDDDTVAVVTNGGGPGVLASDAISDSRLDLATFSESTVSTLKETLPDTAEAQNPLDIIGDAGIRRFQKSLDAVLADEGVSAVVVLCVPTALLEYDQLAETIADCQTQHGTPVATCLMGGEGAEEATATLAKRGIPNAFEPTRAVESLEALADYREVRARTYESPTEFADVNHERARKILEQAIERDVSYLGVEAMELLDAYGIPTPAGGLVTNESDAEELAASIEGPVVVKIVSPAIVHKSDIDGVEVGVPTEDVADTYHAILDRACEHAPDGTILGVRVEALVDPAHSTETIVGVDRDEQFGHLLMFGLGGIFVGVFEDTAFRIAPVSEEEARMMTEEIQAAPMLQGARGRTPADVDAVVETIQRVSQLVTDFPAITELDINPLIVSPEGVCAPDLRLSIDLDDFSRQ